MDTFSPPSSKQNQPVAARWNLVPRQQVGDDPSMPLAPEAHSMLPFSSEQEKRQIAASVYAAIKLHEILL